MSSPGSAFGGARRAPRLRGLRWVGLLLTLTGLLGMHGLAGHGTAGESPDQPGHATHATHATHLGHAVASGTAQAATEVVVVAASAWEDASGGAGMDMGGAATCLAVLLLAAWALLVARAHRVVRPARLPRTPSGRAPVTGARDPRPPDLHVLSVLRC